MSQELRSPPRFQQGQLVHLTAPLDPSAISTWISEGEVPDPNGYSHPRFSTGSAAFNIECVAIPVSNKRRSNQEELTTSSPLPGTSHNTQSSSDIPQPPDSSSADTPSSMLLTEKLVSLVPPHSLLNTIRHATAWHVEEVFPAANDQEEHRYKLCPAERVTAYVCESAMASAPIWVGTIVRKQSQEHGFWIVAGLSIRGKLVWADIMNAEGDCEVVRTDELRMLTVEEALKVLKE